MNLPCPVLLVTHRGLGEGLLTAAETILGERPNVDHLSNDGLSPAELGRQIDEWVENHADGPALILTDLGFGSCCQTVRRATRGRDSVGIVAGVNLPVLLATVRSRDLGDLRTLVTHLGDRGRESLELFLGGEKI